MYASPGWQVVALCGSLLAGFQFYSVSDYSGVAYTVLNLIYRHSETFTLVFSEENTV